MKRLLVRFAAAMGMLAASLTMTTGLAPSAGAQDVLPGVVDITVDLNVVTPVVSPPGTLAMYRVTIGQGVVPTAGSVAVALPGGSSVDTGLTDSACTASGSAVTCSFGANPAVFSIVATTPSAGTYTLTADATASGDLALLEYGANNHDEGSLVVKAAAAGTASGLVKRGQSISLTLNDGRAYTLSVPTTSSRGEQGVIVTIKGENGAGHVCTSSPTGSCGNGFNIWFDQTYPTYTWTDFTNPLVTQRTFNLADPCFGLGNDGCTGIDYTKVDTMALVAMPDCVGRSGGNAGNGQALPGSPCINQKYKQTNGSIWFDVRMTSDDPIELPISKIGL